jgi:hypothetical protein
LIVLILAFVIAASDTVYVIRESSPLVVTGLRHYSTQPPPAKPGDSPPVEYYPPKAHADGTEGEALVQCVYRAASNTFEDCHVVSERPEGQGFGAKAVLVLGFVRPNSSNWPEQGDLKEGQLLQIPVQFRIKDN